MLREEKPSSIKPTLCYYLTYFETRGGHACFALSAQTDLSKPPEILTELGFAPSINAPEDHATKIVQGSVQEETNISVILYSSKGGAEHRTFMISESEMLKFLSIVNSDRRKNIDEKEDYAGNRIGGGPSYQRFAFNCKSWAISVLQRAGIEESSLLSDPLIQIPGSTHISPTVDRVIKSPKATEDLDKSLLTAPLKDGFINDARTLLVNLEEKLDILKLNIKNIDFKNAHGAPSPSEYIQEIDDAIECIQKLLLKKDELEVLGIDGPGGLEKIGINRGFVPVFKELKEHIVALCQYEKDGFVSIKKSKNGTFDKSIYRSAIKKLASAIRPIQDLSALARKVAQECSDETLKYTWKEMPSLSLRISTDHFNDFEKAVYSLHMQPVILHELINALAENGETPYGLLDETFKKYSNLIDKIQQKYSEQTAALDHFDESVMARICKDQHEDLSKIFTSMRDDVQSLMPCEKNGLYRLFNKPDPAFTQLLEEIEKMKRDFQKLDFLFAPPEPTHGSSRKMP